MSKSSELILRRHWLLFSFFMPKAAYELLFFACSTRHTSSSNVTGVQTGALPLAPVRHLEQQGGWLLSGITSSRVAGSCQGVLEGECVGPGRAPGGGRVNALK